MSPDTDRNVVLRGELELAERAGHLFGHAREEFVCAATDLRTWATPGVREQIMAGHWQRPPSLKVRKLYTPAALDDEDSERHLVELSRSGATVRISTAPLPQETIVIDRKVAVLAGAPVAGVREYTVVRSPGVVRSVRSLYEAAWEAAADLAEFRRARPPALGEQSRQILRLLGGGLKDEAAARQLGLSLRTYRRRVAEILTLLDADSRFQAGLRAHELGLLGAPPRRPAG
ncbi:DNA-binding response regulator [Actinomadura miaoliensis]|uniref:Response regulator transcription factor n=1 Tax=Actinomadura miaoliensis TaxID=430685 RepID=A0ABP7X6D3_9ACTN